MPPSRLHPACLLAAFGATSLVPRTVLADAAPPSDPETVVRLPARELRGEVAKVFSKEAGRLEGVHGFVGLALGFGPTLHAYKPFPDAELEGPESYGATLFALQGGVFLHRIELSLEWAPGTYRPMMSDEPPLLDAGESYYSVVGSFGYYIPISDVVYWPLRLGAGAGSERNDLIARLDLIAVAVKARSVVVGLSFPSIRYMSDFSVYHRWTGLFELHAAYVFP